MQSNNTRFRFAEGGQRVGGRRVRRALKHIAGCCRLGNPNKLVNDDSRLGCRVWNPGCRFRMRLHIVLDSHFRSTPLTPCQHANQGSRTRCGGAWPFLVCANHRGGMTCLAWNRCAVSCNYEWRTQESAAEILQVGYEQGKHMRP